MAQIQANIADVSGGSQVAVGDYIVQIGRVEAASSTSSTTHRRLHD
jgi:hypothetical protein